MLPLPFFEPPSPSLTRPTVALEMGGGAADPGGLGGLAATAGALLGATTESPWTRHLVALNLYQTLAPGVDHAQLWIATGNGAPQAELNDSARILMGLSGDNQPLFDGQVSGIDDPGDGLRRYQLSNAASSLAQTRINQGVTQQSVADAIAFAVQPLGISLATDIQASDGVLPQYVFDDSRSLWDHLSYLAGLRGFRLWFDGQGVLHLGDQLEQGESVARYTVGEDLLRARLSRRTAHSGEITVLGGSRAEDGYSLRKQADPNRARQGGGAPQRFYRDSVLGAQQDLGQRADAAARAAGQQTLYGEVEVCGSALLGPGRVIELSGLPQGDGGYLILTAEHRYGLTNGWHTRLSVSSAENASAGLADSLGGLL